MGKLVSEVEEKLVEYGIDIYDHHDIENEEHIFLVEDMIIYARDEEKSISVAFQATTRPDIVANNILILLEIDKLDELDIMESFIFNEKNEMVYGDDAFNLVLQGITSTAIKDFSIDKVYESILKSASCHEC